LPLMIRLRKPATGPVLTLLARSLGLVTTP